MPPIGGECSIIIQGRTPDRRFGLVMLTGGWALRGLRNLKFRIDDLRCDAQNSDFLADILRRLGCDRIDARRDFGRAEKSRDGALESRQTSSPAARWRMAQISVLKLEFK